MRLREAVEAKFLGEISRKFNKRDTWLGYVAKQYVSSILFRSCDQPGAPGGRGIL